MEQVSKRKPGRPTLSPAEKLVVVTIRLSPEDKAKFRRVKKAKFLEWLRRVKE